MTATQHLAGRARPPDTACPDRSRRQLRISGCLLQNSCCTFSPYPPLSMSLTGHGRGDAPGSLPGILARLCRDGKEELVSSEAEGGDGAGVINRAALLCLCKLVFYCLFGKRIKSQFCSSVAFQRCVCDAVVWESRALFSPRAVCGHGSQAGPTLQCVGQGLNQGPGRDSLAQHRDGEKT